MSKARVERGPGPGGTITKNNYRRKSLPYLRRDFKERCAYCLQHCGLIHSNQSHVDHFDAHKPERAKNTYLNLMHSCSSCNLSKHDKHVINPYDATQRMLNCTIENEFPAHISEHESGVWIGTTPAGKYHIESIDLNAPSYVAKRKQRRKLAHEVLELQQSIQYSGSMDVDVLRSLQNVIQSVKEDLRTTIPLITEEGAEVIDDDFLTKHIKKPRKPPVM